ncbi:unnamed protein product [Chilo suppressalis]|uniref:Rad21/Rec8-like protein N-terminal domain-containing protein n=1 Tax=Chilo suppressalis TaxID=168631 RepID=A0ABN8BGS3_CHISP|nr:unnamed protein product [Chilo suppressalis]
MFYPVESLKRGGRFYLCWVADSWPLRFATITHRQLWSQDIRKICDDLLEVMTNESGRPVCRFSLRLSSQLMRGLVRLYQRKVTVFLADLCMINANVTKHVNKKWNISEVVIDVPQRTLPQLPTAPLLVPEEPENEQRIEEIIRNSGNVVVNIEEITLKESAVPEILLPPNDGFGDENPEQLIKDQTIEMMLVQDKSVHHSGMDAALDITDKSHDKTRFAAHDAQMEPIAELDATIFRKSVGADRLTIADLEKDILEIPEIQIPAPDMPVPQPVQQIIEEPPVENIPIQGPTRPEEETVAKDQTVGIQLEELEEEPQTKRRRLKDKLIIDKKIKLTADYLVTRIENPHVELRCEESSDDIVDISVPVEILFRRPCRAGFRLASNIGLPLTRMYQRRLGFVVKHPRTDREMEEIAVERTSRIRTRSLLERIEEEPAIIPERIEVQIEQPMQIIDISKDGANNAGDLQNVTIPMEVDISDLPTQKIVMNESQTRKRTSEHDISPKRKRLSGYVSFRESQHLAIETSVPINEAEKENIPRAANIRTPPPPLPQSNTRPTSQQRRTTQGQDVNSLPPDAVEKSLTVMLEEAGLADLPIRTVAEQEIPQPQATVSQRVTRRGGDSESSETPLGSLDRTKVSLGDSDQTTDSKKFIRDQWGTEGTMVKILRNIKAGMKPLTVRKLIDKGPVIAGYKAIMAARCFSSILKLKQHGFIIVKKVPDTLEIKDILLGPKFDSVK